MSSKKVLAVVGGTGRQGSSVIKTFVGLPGWHVRCLTRNSSSEKARKLESLGAELVVTNNDDIDSLRRAFEGAHAVFANTDFWHTFSSTVGSHGDMKKASREAYDTEIRHGKNIALAASEVQRLERFIYSAIPSMNTGSMGKYTNALHSETKAEIVKFIEQETPELVKKTSFIYLGAYATNAFLLPHPNPTTGEFELAFPGTADTKVPITNPDTSTGPFVRALIENEEPGKKLLAYDSYMSLSDAVEAWSEASGKEGRFVQMSLEDIHHTLAVPYEVLDGAGYLAEFHYMAGVDGFIEPSQLTSPVSTPSFAEFLRTQDSDFLLRGKVFGNLDPKDQ